MKLEINIPTEELCDCLLEGLEEYFPPDAVILEIKPWIDRDIARETGPMQYLGWTIIYERQKLSKGTIT